uniref:Cyclin-like domain-containing protein n=1 Tax=Esox lucius TaxID=8010 RepID=A0A3P9A7W1_ESOLU
IEKNPAPANISQCPFYQSSLEPGLVHMVVAMAIKPCYLEGRDVSSSIRSALVDRLVQIQMLFRLHQETLYMTVSIIDRFHQVLPNTTEATIRLIGVTTMLIASKYEEICPPVVEDFAHSTNFTYSCSKIRSMERTILKALNYEMGRPPPVHFPRRAAKIALVSVQSSLAQLDPFGHGLAMYLQELTLLDYDSVHYPPSLTAAAAVSLSWRILHDHSHNLAPHQICLCENKVRQVLGEMGNDFTCLQSAWQDFRIENRC